MTTMTRLSAWRAFPVIARAQVESFFATLKKELVAGEAFYTRSQARREIVDYIEGFYNCWPLHSSLGQISPATFEEQAR